MKKKNMEKKKRQHVRTRDWDKHHEFSYTHDLVKHRRAMAKLPESAAGLNPLPANFEPNGMVISHSKKWAFVRLDNQERLCLIDERLKERESTLLAPGDAVLVEFEEADAIVRGVAPRRTKLSRPAGPRGNPPEQVFAANIDALIIVASVAQPRFKDGLVDRFLIAANIGGVEPILCINKMDLAEEEPPQIQAYRNLGIRVFPTSCATGMGIDALREAIRGLRCVLSGHSGVGKSSLLNALDPNLEVLTDEVSPATEKGRHTTSTARLYHLKDNVWIIDTPGIRALGLLGVSAEELACYFPEMAEAAAGCHYYNCTHTHEPKCAVRTALESGQIAQARYDSYIRIRASMTSEDGLTPGRFGTRR